jgi:hypothetical protein
MDETIPCDDFGFPICDFEGLNGLFLYPRKDKDEFKELVKDLEECPSDSAEHTVSELMPLDSSEHAVSNLMPPEWFKIQYRNTIFKIGPPQVIITKSGDIIKDEYGVFNEYGLLNEYGHMDEIINFDELKNDELVRLNNISHDAKLEEIFKRIQESKTPQFFECKACYDMWGCSWCGHGFCDDIMSPYKLEGKPQFWSINDVNPEYWKSKTEKEKRKIIKKYEERPPILKNFFLCKWCKNEYIDKNISKGRHPKKIGRKLNTF